MKHPIDCSGASAERRKLQKIKECGFAPKAATHTGLLDVHSGMSNFEYSPIQ